MPPALARRDEVATSRIWRSISSETPSISLRATLPVKPSVTTTSALPAGTSLPSTLPTKSNVSPSARRSRRAACASTTSGVPLLASSPIESRPDARALDAEHDLGQRGAHEAELDEVLGAHLGVGADVDDGHRVPGDRDRDGQRRAVDARGALDVEQRGGQRGTGRAAADEGVRVARRDRARGEHDRGIGVRATGAHGVGRLGDGDGSVDDLDPLGDLAELLSGPEEHDAHALLGCVRRARGDFGGPEVGAVGVDRDRDGHAVQATQ